MIDYDYLNSLLPKLNPYAAYALGGVWAATNQAPTRRQMDEAAAIRNEAGMWAYLAKLGLTHQLRGRSAAPR